MIVLCATTGKRLPALGADITNECDVLTDSRPGWANAANALLDQAAERGQHALFVDDDIELTTDSLSVLTSILRSDRDADVFGFTLFTNGAITSAGFHATPDGGLRPQQMLVDLFRPSLVAHVTASCMFIKREVLQAGVRFPVWPGQHHEDVAFTYDCWLHGFRVAYVPGVVHHHMDMSVGVGATKSQLPTFQQDRQVNYACLQQWIAEHGVVDAIRAGKIPTEWTPL